MLSMKQKVSELIVDLNDFCDWVYLPILAVFFIFGVSMPFFPFSTVIVSNYVVFIF